ncbi:MAG: hypothetical protein RMY36_028540 [Nostoc sp. SerVER01]|nr:hypothetical protein [Nostoc sp. SerVER01]
MVNSFPAINISATKSKAYKRGRGEGVTRGRGERGGRREGVTQRRVEITPRVPASQASPRPRVPASPYPHVPHSGRNFCHVIKSLLVYFSGL